jgi:hypothetical protein
VCDDLWAECLRGIRKKGKGCVKTKKAVIWVRIALAAIALGLGLVGVLASDSFL